MNDQKELNISEMTVSQSDVGYVDSSEGFNSQTCTFGMEVEREENNVCDAEHIDAVEACEKDACIHGDPGDVDSAFTEEDTADLSGKYACELGNTPEISGDTMEVDDCTAEKCGKYACELGNTEKVSGYTTEGEDNTAGVCGNNAWIEEVGGDTMEEGRNTVNLHGKDECGRGNTEVSKVATEVDVNGSLDVTEIGGITTDVCGNNVWIHGTAGEVNGDTAEVGGNTVDLCRMNAWKPENTGDVIEDTTKFDGNPADVCEKDAWILENTGKVSEETTEVAGDSAEGCGMDACVPLNSGESIEVDGNCLKAYGNMEVCGNTAYEDATVARVHGPTAEIQGNTVELHKNITDTYRENTDVDGNTECLLLNTTDVNGNTVDAEGPDREGKRNTSQFVTTTTVDCGKTEVQGKATKADATENHENSTEVREQTRCVLGGNLNTERVQNVKDRNIQENCHLETESKHTRLKRKIKRSFKNSFRINIDKKRRKVEGELKEENMSDEPHAILRKQKKKKVLFSSFRDKKLVQDNAMDFEQIPVCERIDLGWQSESDEDDDTNFDHDDWHRIAPVKFFTHELSIRGRLRRLLIRNSSSRLASTFFDLVIRCLICLIYIVRVQLDDMEQYECKGSPASACRRTNSTADGVDDDNMLFSSTDINWYVLLWVQRPLWLWITQVVLSAITICKALLLVYVTTRGHRMEQLLTTNFFLEVICSTPYVLTVTYPPLLQHLFVPGFLNCWLARLALERIFNDLHLTRTRFQTISVTLSQQILLLTASLFCMVFTTICGIQHIQRGSSESPLTMFESLYFVIVTFSTVGYGDISPDIWLGQLFMILMICIALAFIPRQIEVIASTWIERQKAGGEYSHRAAARNKHVVVCSSVLNVEAIMDFLNEFYAHPKLEEHMVILLSPRELDNSMQVILKDPKWTHRVIYMRGSPLKDIDLKRCRIHQADACFFLAPRSAVNKAKADQHTILRSWAVKDFAPNCKQYIQLFKAKNKLHVKFAEHVVCEDEFKYALLANNCLYPGLSTLVSLLVHTSSGVEGDIASEPWQQVYGRHAGNEIYHIQAHKSIFFSSYVGKKFTEASADAHQRFGVALLAVLDPLEKDPKLLLNPGPNHILKKTDYCFYMSVTKEEYSRINPEALKEDVPKSERVAKNLEQIALALQKYQNEDEDDDGESVFDTITSMMGQEITKLIKKDQNKNNNEGVVGEEAYLDIEKTPDVINIDETGQDTIDGVSHRTGPGRVLQYYHDMGQERFTIGAPPITMYVGSRRTQCHIVEESRPFCCLEWGTSCDHCKFKNANDDRWQNQLIILAAEQASSGIYNFIVPLRSNFISMNSLSPIILLVEEEPGKIFLETIAKFPLVYWMKGRITSVDDLLTAGINKASHLVVVNRTPNNKEGEETLCDAQTIVAVQTIFRLFPNANIITELNQASNMRFMQFRAHDIYSQRVSRLEQKLKQTMGSNMSHIFRLPFAGGQVFSASMLDTLLYQTFVKGYLITFVRLLLGIDAEENSGHLSSIRVRPNTVARFPTYGELYQGLCTATGEIPIAIYRTERQRTRGDMSDSTDHDARKLSHFSPKNPFVSFQYSDHVDLADVIRTRLRSLDLCEDDYCGKSKRSGSTLSYTIANPSPKRRLKVGDIVYVIQPSSMVAIPGIQKWRPRAHSYSGPMRSSDRSTRERRGSVSSPFEPGSKTSDAKDAPQITPILKSRLVAPASEPAGNGAAKPKPALLKLPTRLEPLKLGDDVQKSTEPIKSDIFHKAQPKPSNTNPIITVTTTGNRKYEVQKVTDEIV